MMKRFTLMRIFLNAFVAFLTLFYLWMLFLGIVFRVRFDYAIVVIGLLFGCSVGLLFRRPWAVKGMSWVGLAGVLTAVIEFIRGGMVLDGLILAFFFFSLFAFMLLQERTLQHLYLGVRSPFPTHTILLIDDDRGLLQLLHTNLRKEGFFVLTAETGEKGLALAKQFRPDLILLDVILPGLKGRKVCSMLQEDPRTKGIPVLFLTAKDSPDDIQAEMAAGGVAHITKPVDYRNLLHEIKKYLPH